jgi:hypothetical protein
LPTQGNGQTVSSGTKFPIALKGHWLDQYGNVGFPPLPAELKVDPYYGGTWPNGQNSITVNPGADGTITAPDLTAGNIGRNDPSYGAVFVLAAGFDGWGMLVTPGPAAKVAAVSGASQQTAARKPFARALAVKVTDARGHPIAGAPVFFNVTSGKATFPPVNLHLAAAAVIGAAQALLKHGNPRRIAVTEATDGRGVATAPALTAGPNAGPIEVTASVGVSHTIKTVFRPSVVSAPRRPRSPHSRTATAR